MKQVTLNNQNYLLVEVPADAYDFNWNCLYDWKNYLLTFFIKGQPQTFSNKDKYYFDSRCQYMGSNINSNYLPKIIGKISDILKDEAVCKGLVESHNYKTPNKWNKDLIMYRDYNYNFNDEKLFDFDYSKHSFLSYLQSINLDMDKEYVLIQKL